MRYITEMQKMQNEMDRLFNRMFRGTRELGPKNKGLSLHEDFRRPQADIQETESKYVALFEMPGVSKDNIELKVTNDAIEIKASQNFEQKSESEKKDAPNGSCCYVKKSNTFYTKLKMPSDVKAQDTQARYRDGVLTLEIPKVASKENTIKIEVE